MANGEREDNAERGCACMMEVQTCDNTIVRHHRRALHCTAATSAATRWALLQYTVNAIEGAVADSCSLWISVVRR